MDEIAAKRLLYTQEYKIHIMSRGLWSQCLGYRSRLDFAVVV